MMTDVIDVVKLKVPELRVELGKRGLNTFGTKQILMDRLQEAINVSSKHADNSIGEPPCITSPIFGKQGNLTPTKVDSQDTDQTAVIEISPCKNNENGYTEEKIDLVKDLPKDNDYSKRRRSSSPKSRDRDTRRSPSPRSRDKDTRCSPSPRSRDRDVRRSPRRSHSPSSKSKLTEETNDWEKSTSVFLDGYNCDLNLLIDANGYAAKPQTNMGFSLMWAGVRANYGVTIGKVFYEVRVVKHIPVESLDSLVGGATHVLRLGWSTENTDFTLGEDEQSYGYGGTGKKSSNNKFTDYGCTFSEGDVVGAFVEWTEVEAVLRFSVNGVDQGECYRILKSSLGNHCILFPHVYVKNVEFSVNFGQDNQPAWFNPNILNDDPMSWILINNMDVASRMRGRLPPSSKSECEVIMMVGLPGSGKTYFADHHCVKYREKQYTILSTNFILDKMKVVGLARQRNYHGRWDVLIEKASKCLNILIGLACMRRRNYIIDQTNVFPSAQRRKMRPFEGFKRKAIVIIPTDEELRRQIAQREKDEGKEVPESAVLEMKANFGIPKSISEDPSSVFDEVIFTRLAGEDARILVEKYNQEGQASKPPPQKRQRWDGDNRRDDSRFHGRDNRDKSSDFNRGRRDDINRSPNRFEDRGRRDYKGGYNSSRDRSRDDERFDRNRSRDRGRQTGGHYGGPNEHFGAPNRGGYPGPGNYSRGFDGSRGSMIRGGLPRGAPRGSFEGSGFDGSRGRRGAPRGLMDRGFSGANDRMYGGCFDDSNQPDLMMNPYSNPSDPTASQLPYEGGPMGGGYHGGYNGPNAGRGAHGFSRGNTSNRGSGEPMGRGGVFQGRDNMARGGASQDRDNISRGMSSAVRGVPPMRGRGVIPNRGGRPSDRDCGSGFSDGSQPPFGTYGSESYQGGEETFQGSSDKFRGRSNDRYRGGPYGPSTGGKQPQEYPNTYQRNNAFGPPGYPGNDPSGYPGAPQGSYQDSTAAYPSVQNTFPGCGPEEYSGSGSPKMSGNRPIRSAPTTGISRSYGSNEPSKANQETGGSDNINSLYASGASKFSDNHLPGQTQLRQSRFDSKSPINQNNQNAYSNYSMNNFPGSYGNVEGTQSVPPQVSNVLSNGPKNGRSRFDTASGSTLASVSISQVSQTQIASRLQQSSTHSSQLPISVSQPQTAQTYGYGYCAPGAKADASQTMQPTYGAYGYGYGYGGYNQVVPPTTAPRPAAPSLGSTQSLYASAVANKPQSTLPTGASTPSTALSSDQSAAAYASYYYGAQTGASTAQGAGKYDAAMAAAQQFNAWQQQQTTTNSGSTGGSTASATAAQTATAYGSYYPGYSAYPAGYNSVPIATAPTNTIPNAAAPVSAQRMPQYYAGYR